MGDFVAQWLRTDEVLTVTKDRPNTRINGAHRAAMAQVRRLFYSSGIGRWRKVHAFFDADFTYANADLAKFYGLSGASSSALVKCLRVLSAAVF